MSDDVLVSSGVTLFAHINQQSELVSRCRRCTQAHKKLKLAAMGHCPKFGTHDDHRIILGHREIQNC